MSEQEIRVGQRWRRKSDGVVVGVVRVERSGMDSVYYATIRGERRTSTLMARSLRARYDLIEADQ